MSATKRFRVAICGGGIGGLTLALALSKYPDIDVDVYEAAAKLTELGAGVGLFPRPWKIARLLGIDADLLKTTERQPQEGPVTAFRYRKSDQPQGLEFYTLVTQGSLITLHRADFQSTLLQHLPRSCRTHCGKRLCNYTPRSNGSVDLAFEDGTTAQCDILVGADGFKSVVRQIMLRERAAMAQKNGRTRDAEEILSSCNARWTGQIAYRSLIPAERLRARSPNHRSLTIPTQFLGKNGYVISYPIQHGKFINCVAFTMRHDLEGSAFNGPWVTPADPSVFTGTFANWEPDVQTLLECVEKPLAWVVPTVGPLRSFVSGRVVLLGDAAHAQAPHQGYGAGSALEDAYILATALGHRRINRETIPRALQVYDEIRRPAATVIHEKSRLNGRYFTMETENLGFNVDKLSGQQLNGALQQVAQTFTQNWEWAWNSSIDGSVQEALRLLG